MRLDHLLSREKAGRETERLNPGSIVASRGAMQKKGPKGPKADSVLPVHSVSFSGFDARQQRPKFHPEPASKEAGSRCGKRVKGIALAHLDNCI